MCSREMISKSISEALLIKVLSLVKSPTLQPGMQEELSMWQLPNLRSYTRMKQQSLKKPTQHLIAETRIDIEGTQLKLKRSLETTWVNKLTKVAMPPQLTMKAQAMWHNLQTTAVQIVRYWWCNHQLTIHGHKEQCSFYSKCFNNNKKVMPHQQRSGQLLTLDTLIQIIKAKTDSMTMLIIKSRMTKTSSSGV